MKLQVVEYAKSNYWSDDRLICESNEWENDEVHNEV